MENEKRDTKWAVPCMDREKVQKGKTVGIREILPDPLRGGFFMHGLYLKEIYILDIEEVAPNMLILRTETKDYYMYNYDLPKESIYFPEKDSWKYTGTPEIPEIGEKMHFRRCTMQNNFQEEDMYTDPVFKIDVISRNYVVAWCNDSTEGKEKGYVIEVANAKNTGNYYWIWSMSNSFPKDGGNCKLVVDIVGYLRTTDINFVFKSATAIGDGTLFEGEDGNFYIAQVPFRQFQQFNMNRE